MINSETSFIENGVCLVFLCKDDTSTHIKERLTKVMNQSLTFSEIHIISYEEYIEDEILPKNQTAVRLHRVSNDRKQFSQKFYEIIRASECSQLIITSENLLGDTKYSLERFSLRARLSSNSMEINSDFSAHLPSSQYLFGKIENYIFSRQWLISNGIFLSGMSENDQAAFLAEAIAVSATESISCVIDNMLSKKAFTWAEKLSLESFESAVYLCKKVFEIAENRLCPKMAHIGYALTDSLIKVCGKFITPYDSLTPVSKYECELLKELAGNIRLMDNVANAERLSHRIDKLFVQPLVSVIIPAYNVEKEIQRCLDSVFSQTLKSVEIICVDDGSDDKTLEILRENEKNHPNLLVITQKNSGQAHARNVALSLAKGKYLAFVDSDDWIEPFMLEKMSMCLERYEEAEIVKCGTYCDFTYPVSKEEKLESEKYFSEAEPQGLHRINSNSLLTGVVWDKLYRASLINENKIRFPEYVKNEDEAFALFLVCRAKQFYLLKDKFYHYIKNPSGTMNTQKKLASYGILPDVFSICNLMLDFLIQEKKYSYFGRVIKTILGATDRFENLIDEDTLNHAVSSLLVKAQYPIYAETIIREKRNWCMQKAAKYANLYYEYPFDFRDLSQWLPPVLELCAENEFFSPILTFVVPVHNAERYLASTIESLRNQSLFEIEILCINDGSTDKSEEILEQYKDADSRIRVISQNNIGVSATRNKGMAQARGKYIAFVDADDFISPNMANMCVSIAEKNSLDVVSFDYQCFDCTSGKYIDHYWTISNHKTELPLGQIFNIEAFRNGRFAFYGSSCAFLWKKSFLVENGINFPAIKISEDVCFVIDALTNAERVTIIPEALYYYRRNTPGSAITSLKGNQLIDPRVDTVDEFFRLIDSVGQKSISTPAKAKVIERLLSEMCFFTTVSDELKCKVETEIRLNYAKLSVYSSMFYDRPLRKWMESTCASIGNGAELKKLPDKPKLPKLSADAAFWWSKIESSRQKSKHDLILVFSFLGSKTADPIDSWTFFCWLQEHNIPSRFITSKNSLFYKDLVAKKKTHGVIALGKSCLQDDHAAYFLRKLVVPLSRAKALVFEDFVWPWPLRARFKQMDWKLIFLQHGLSYFKMTSKFCEFFSRFNYVNVCSAAEKEFLLSSLKAYGVESENLPECIIAGLPRWEKLVDAAPTELKKPVIFVMFTWRVAFQNPNYRINDSMYCNAIITFLKSQFINEFKQQGIKIVFAPHHRFLDLAPEVVKNLPVELCYQKDISYWVKNASCLVTDYSSIAWDFMFQNKPVVFWAMDQNDISLGEEHQLLADNYKRVSEVSSPVYSLRELKTRLQFYVENNFRNTDEDNERIKRFFPYHDGFSQRVYEKICCCGEQKGLEN